MSPCGSSLAALAARSAPGRGPAASGLARLLVLTLATGCAPEMFRVTGFAQERFTNKADVLFVIDNSLSMVEENDALQAEFGVFVEQLAGAQGDATSEGLADAVDNYIDFAARRTTFIDFHLGVTTTDVAATYGGLYGDNPVIEFGEPDPVEDFRASVDDAVGLGGAGNEEGLEAVFMALCRGVAEPPEPCFDEQNQFTQEDVGSNGELFREGAAFIPVIVTDEGDVSRRKDEVAGDDVPDEYDALFQLFDQRITWAVIGPQEGVCNGTTPVPQWAIDRYAYFVDQTDGLWVDISAGEPDCEVTDFSVALQQLGDLINRLSTIFPLQVIPDPATIVVFVDGKLVDQAEPDGEDFGDGWSYDPGGNAVRFHGDAVPDFNSEVRIYYLPISGNPRDLPF